ncbi:MAG: hypothetical protein MUP45_01935 [Candidatus Marinimicrobia bacterium]|nr:hypothetical protein [Candidatus Neomarinimicrobiota bacterium]
MTINWEETSWRSLEEWQMDASHWGCPVANEYHGELPPSRETITQIYYMYCDKNCGMNAGPFPPWEPCPFERQMAKEIDLLE